VSPSIVELAIGVRSSEWQASRSARENEVEAGPVGVLEEETIASERATLSSHGADSTGLVSLAVPLVTYTRCMELFGSGVSYGRPTARFV
jgi:hypothetical protein